MTCEWGWVTPEKIIKHLRFEELYIGLYVSGDILYNTWFFSLKFWNVSLFNLVKFVLWGFQIKFPVSNNLFGSSREKFFACVKESLEFCFPALCLVNTLICQMGYPDCKKKKKMNEKFIIAKAHLVRNTWMPMFSLYLVFKMWLTELLILIFHSTEDIIHLNTCYGLMMEDCISSPLDFGLDQIICFGQFNVDGCERDSPKALMRLDCILELFHDGKIILSVLSEYVFSY